MPDHRSPCRTAPPWRNEWRGGPPRRFPRHAPGWNRKRRFLLRRFIAAIFVFMLLVFGVMAGLALIVTQLTGGSGQDWLLIWMGGCGLALLVPVLVIGGGLRAYHRYAAPLADVMAAADAVADGDLSVRVSEDASGEVGQLARSFNRMTEELERSDRQRRNMTADVAHELRTPLHIIQGNLEGILDHVYEPSDEQIAATLDETRDLARLVEDLETISLAEAGQLPLVQEPVDIRELLDDIATSFGPTAEASDVRLVVETEGNLSDLTVDGDPGRLDQVMTNLVANALRHTQAGGKVSLSAVADADVVRVVVEDNGEGIEGEDLPHVFDRFWRGDRARSRTDGAGGGLGLAIVRQLVEAHGGYVDVQSTVGEGSAFVVTLPRHLTTPDVHSAG